MPSSSNDQIIGYKDFTDSSDRIENEYPLKSYLEKGLRVTVNTDNPGISRTSPSEEYLKAALRLSKDGLSLWQILQLIRNGFRSAFLNHKQRRDCYLEAEQRVVKVLSTFFCKSIAS